MSSVPAAQAATLAAPPVAADATLDAIEWTHVTPTFQAVGHRFALRTNVAAVGRHFEYVFADLLSTGAPNHWYSFIDRGPRARKRWAAYVDGRRVSYSSTPDYGTKYLLWHVNAGAIGSRVGHLQVHASVAANDGVAVMFPAPMESGKTTLVAALVMAGMGYLTDEMASIDPETGVVHPYPKPLSIGHGSWRVLADLAPELPRDVERFFRGQWHVPASAIRPDSVAGPTPLGPVVFPRYDPTRPTALSAVSRAEALADLWTSLFNREYSGRDEFMALASLVRDRSCYRLSVNDLGAACAAVLGLFP